MEAGAVAGGVWGYVSGARFAWRKPVSEWARCFPAAPRGPPSPRVPVPQGARGG